MDLERSLFARSDSAGEHYLSLRLFVASVGGHVRGTDSFAPPEPNRSQRLCAI